MKIATIGTSKITKNFLDAVSRNPEAEAYAAYSRNLEKAREFGQPFGMKKFYDSLEELGADQEVEGVYIASPNSLHCGQALAMLKAGKHVLCEKTLGSNAREEELMFQTASENQAVLLEAMRPVHDPALKLIRDNLGKLGKIRKVFLEYCQYSSRYDAFREGKTENIFKKEMSAGALMDIGVYCVEALLYLFGEPLDMTARAVFLDNGIDGAGSILAEYEGMTADVSYSKITSSDALSQIQGENGTLYIEKVSTPERAFIRYQNGSTEELAIPACSNNMCYELAYFMEAAAGKENPEYYQRLTQTAIRMMDCARKQTGLVFPADSKMV
ncbi:MAG: Gfo/Idh/MocA family oxidoreductase [Eubacteriales bacterium]|nr:Gfo/Idh/MocA family oxidoreductase [Eubacteriales bacterium]